MTWAKSIFGRSKIEAELTRELEFHREEAIAAKIADGMAPEEARRQVRLDLGGAEQIMEECRDVHRLAWLENWLLDARFALRTLRKTPSFTILAVLVLGLGIGANTAIFSVVNAVLLRPLPFPAPDRLIAVASQQVAAPASLVSLRNGSRLVEYAGYSQDSEVNLTGRGEPARLVASLVSANLFRVLGVRPLLGSDFQDGEDLAGHGHSVLLSYALWKRRFDSDPRVVGQSVVIDDEPRAIAGVMPPDFQFPSANTELWLPVSIDPTDVSAYYFMANLPLVGRLRPGTSLEQAEAEFAVLLAPVRAKYANTLPGWGKEARLATFKEVIVARARGYLFLLLGAVGLVLLIACANFSNLLVVRNIVRKKELAVRAALGASRIRLLQQVLAESLMVALAGGTLGLALAWSGTGILIAHLPAGTPRLPEIGLDSHVFAFTGLISIITGLALGLIPALNASRLDGGSIHLTERNASGARRHMLDAFAVVEAAVAVIVVIGAGLLAKSVWRLSGKDPGFEVDHVLTMRLTPPATVCQEHARCVEFYRQVLEQVRALHGVANASAVSSVPLTGHWEFAAEVEGHPWRPGTPVTLVWDWQATPDYFATMRIPVLQGRAFAESDAESSEPVAVVSAAAAKKNWPGENPIGKHIRGIWEKQWRRVIGVVGDVHNTTLGADPSAHEAQAYFPFAAPLQSITAMTLAIRTTGDPLQMAETVRRTIAQASSEVPVSHIQTMHEVVVNSMSEPLSTMWLLASFAALSLLLGAVGIYGVISYGVTQRVREIGIRMALGAERFDILRLILAQSLRHAGVGVLIGLPVALAATRVLRSQLFEVSTADPLTYVLAAMVVAGAALLAGGIPARRAVQLHPAAAIREE